MAVFRESLFETSRMQLRSRGQKVYWGRYSLTRHFVRRFVTSVKLTAMVTG